MNLLERFIHAPALYPVSCYYALGVGDLALVADKHLGLANGIVALGIGAVLLILNAIRRDGATLRASVGEVHVLVNSQRTAMLERIDVLIAAMTAAGITVPDDPAEPRTAAAQRKADQ